jgi:poly(hydroxyalkanoate) granule-associated protein
MVKKMKSTATPAADAKAARHDSQLAGAVKASAHQIWLAGMGAFAKAQEEGGKVFEALVKEGMSLQKKTQGMAEEKIGEVTGKMTAMADTVSAKANQNWDKLESIFEARTAKALGRLGVPTAKDVQALTARVDELAAAVAALGGNVKPARAPRAAARKGAADGAAAAKKPARARRVAAAEPAATPTPAKAARGSRRRAAAA